MVARSLRERTRDPKWWGEQVAHFCFIAAPPVAICLGLAEWGGPGWQPLAGFCASAWIVLLRELIDQWPIDSLGDMLVDLAASISGGTVTGLLFMVI